MFGRTKKFLKKSIQTFKSYFSESGYEKLPKNPSYNGHNSADYSLETVYSEFVNQWETTDRTMTISYEHNTDTLKHNKPSVLIDEHEFVRRNQQKYEETSRDREEKRSLVTKRLKELQILDRDNVDHVLDIQEVLHFYSRLTCPVYREMVEKFFMEMYSEAYSLLCATNSTPKRISFRV